MVTTTCKELAGVNCSVPLTGGSAQELQQNVFAHAQKDHADLCAKMSPQDQTKMAQRIQDIYNQKATLTVR
jgi:predicted small metal-binding protein